MRLKTTIFGLALACAVQASAIEFISTNSYGSAAGEAVAQEQWISADIINLEGTHENDLFLMGGHSLTLSGTFEGNIWGASGQSTILSGESKRSVRLTGKAVTINGKVDGNVMALADTVILGTNAVVGGDVQVFANTVVQQGTIKGDAAFYSARMLTFSGTIEGNTRAAAPEILFMRNARLEGNLSYTSGKKLVPVKGVVGGELKRTIAERPPMVSTAKLVSQFMWFLAALFVGLPFISLFPMSTAMSTQVMRKAPLKCLLVGFVAFWGLLAVSIPCMFSGIGTPLGLLLFGTWAALAYLSHIVVALVVGSLLLKNMAQSVGKVVLTMVIGLAMLYIIAVIPSPLLLFQQIVAFLGMGALILSLIEKRRLIIQVPQQLKKAVELKNEQNETTEDSP